MSTTVHQTEATLVAVLVQLIVIVLCARLAGSAAIWLRQPRAVGEIVAGLLLGPSFFGLLMPGAFAAVFTSDAAAPMTVLSQIGLILLMFQIGSDFEFNLLGAAENRRAALFVAVASLFGPLFAGFCLGRLSAPLLAPDSDPFVYSLFVAVALAITAVPILGRILREYALTHHTVGVIAISAAAVNDVVGWLLLAGVTAYATAAFSPAGLGVQIGGLAVLVLALRVAGQPAVAWLLRRFPVEDDRLPSPLMAIVLALIFAAGICTQKLGIFTIFGGFLLGLLFHRQRGFVEAWRRQVGGFVLVFFLPVFFTYTGLRTSVLGLGSIHEWAWCAAFFLAAVISKVIPVYLGGRAAGLQGRQSLILGVLMNTRALMELIVLNIGLSLGFIPPDVFTMLVIMAVGTTIMTGPLLRLLLPRAGYEVRRVVEA
jgi:Kef-type K+ transport system membrane component KefB